MSGNKRTAAPRSPTQQLKKAKMVEIDENLHSRQLAVYGREAMRRMASAAVLISGANGLGVEIAKNVILAGVRSVTIHDKKTVEKRDLSAQFYLTEEDVGQNRAEACKDKLQELNTAVAVSASSADLDEAFLQGFQVVVVTGGSLAESKRIDEFCHKQSPAIAFIRAETRGVFASVFTDFGPDFTVFDVNGEEPHTGIVESITTGNPAMVTCVEDERLEFQDGQLVTFAEVQGMTELNSYKPIKILNCKRSSFQLDLDTAKFGDYQRGGIVTQFKEPKALAFKTLAERLANPGELLMSDFSKFERPALLHVGFQALDAFEAEHGRCPKPANKADAEAVVALAKKLNEGLPEDARATIDEAVLAKLAHCASGEINPMAAMFGGVVGQEVMKAVSGKFHPIHQLFYFDSVESLPTGEFSADEFVGDGGRYDAQVAVLGRSMQTKLAALNVFLVGAGALGCEFLKNFAMMGIATAGPGRVTVTDDDVIEKSNLSRQFLFRDRDIGEAKSSCASAATLKLNPGIKLNALKDRVSPDTEAVFNDSFWGELDVVVNALDNVNARLYVDSRCVYFCKPLLESGTLGPKCNTQVVVPRMTENYGASRDPPEKQAPMCTLHSFPHNIDHCLTWARSDFEGVLEKSPSEANTYLADPEKYAAAIRANPDAAAREQLEKAAELLVGESVCHTFEDCIKWARLRFQDLFHNRIAQLIFTFPEDATTSTGAPFWSAPKRFPTPLVFDGKDPTHASLVQAAAILKAEVHGVERPAYATDTAAVGAKAAEVVVEPFQPKKGVHIETDPKAEKRGPVMAADDESLIEGLLDRLAKAALKPGFRLNPIEFEKDDDTNYHMDLIAGLANMRARNYQIPEVDKLKAKLIAGRIIPAIATATAVATGLVCLELYKIVAGGKKIEDFRNTFANMALPMFAMCEPIAPKTFKHESLEWSLWDRWTLEGDLTCQQVLDWFEERKLHVYSISCGQSLLYNNIFPKHKERLGKKMSELVVTIAKMEIPEWRSHFDIVVACEDDEGEDLDVPLVSIKFR
uniref:E1 ubiquitin-activating enzyme n=1 Tax=Chlamydomonas euryale TaxID=1486919 RepID=A0A7R9V7B7_9CHLO|mmetsp:Transcript_24149/g.71655  ORF Transcript_24149/g.71655 Transcript_24149/m.71655 type:complete len:1033 (+) Transcript_24149:36-3134(+)